MKYKFFGSLLIIAITLLVMVFALEINSLHRQNAKLQTEILEMKNEIWAVSRALQIYADEHMGRWGFLHDAFIDASDTLEDIINE